MNIYRVLESNQEDVYIESFYVVDNISALFDLIGNKNIITIDKINADNQQVINNETF